MRRDICQCLIAHDPSARQVLGLGFAFPPGSQRLQSSEHLQIAPLRLHPQPGLFRIIDIIVGIGELFHLGVDPHPAARFTQFFQHFWEYFGKMGDIGYGIFQLARVERAARPVGEPGALVQCNAKPAVNQIGIADLFALADRHRCNLGVKNRMRGLAGDIVDDLDILPAGVENLEDVFIVDQQFHQRPEINALGKGVNRGCFLAIGNLDQAENRPIGVLAHELCINRHKIRSRKASADIDYVLIVRQQFMDVHFYPIQRAAHPANYSWAQDKNGGKPWHFGH